MQSRETCRAIPTSGAAYKYLCSAEPRSIVSTPLSSLLYKLFSHRLGTRVLIILNAPFLLYIFNMSEVPNPKDSAS
jgi:hypothetical protein